MPLTTLIYIQRPEHRRPPADMEQWLEAHNIPFRSGILKPELYPTIMQNKPSPVYKTDRIVRQYSHQALGLPLYHCDSNPIEIIWGQEKGQVSHENSSFSLKSTIDLTEKGKEIWKKYHGDLNDKKERTGVCRFCSSWKRW